MSLIANDPGSTPRREEKDRTPPQTLDTRQRQSARWQPAARRSTDGRSYLLRAPSLSDGAQLWDLVRSNGPLELNSPYSYVLLARYFHSTCVVAERNAQPVAFSSAFISPADAETLFVWQIAVNASERGQGLARELLRHLLARPACQRVRFLEATVAPSNAASRSLFHSLARDLRAHISVHAGLRPELFPDGAHEQEELVCIGPLPGEREATKRNEQAQQT